MRICSRSSKSETRGIRRRRVRVCAPGSKRTAATVHSKSSTAAILTISLDSGEVSALGRHPLEQALTLSGDDLSNELGFGQVHGIGSGVGHVADAGEVVE